MLDVSECLTVRLGKEDACAGMRMRKVGLAGIAWSQAGADSCVNSGCDQVRAVTSSTTKITPCWAQA